jgi:hypothetical protein
MCKSVCLLQNRLGALRSFAHLRQLQLCQVYADDALTRLLQGLTDLQVRIRPSRQVQSVCLPYGPRVHLHCTIACAST